MKGSPEGTESEECIKRFMDYGIMFVISHYRSDIMMIPKPKLVLEKQKKESHSFIFRLH